MARSPGGGVRRQIAHERCFQRGQGELVNAQRPVERIFLNPGHDFFFADDDTRLRAAQKLVSAEGDDIDTGPQRFADRRFAVQAVPVESYQTAAAQVVHDRHTVPLSQ